MKSMPDFHNQCIFVEEEKSSGLLMNGRQRELSKRPRQHTDKGRDVLIPQEAQVIITTNRLVSTKQLILHSTLHEHVTSHLHAHLSLEQGDPVAGDTEIAQQALSCCLERSSTQLAAQEASEGLNLSRNNKFYSSVVWTQRKTSILLAELIFCVSCPSKQPREGFGQQTGCCLQLKHI